jgi:hypothetical protein
MPPFADDTRIEPKPGTPPAAQANAAEFVGVLIDECHADVVMRGDPTSAPEIGCIVGAGIASSHCDELRDPRSESLCQVVSDQVGKSGHIGAADHRGIEPLNLRSSHVGHCAARTGTTQPHSGTCQDVPVDLSRPRASHGRNVANERLRTAMAVAQVDLDAIAEATGANVKTVQRWINGRTPVARFRSKIVQLVGEEETYLWPEILDGDRVRTATESELIALYARRAQVPADVWLALFRRADRNIDILAYAAVFLHEQDPHLNDLLREKAAAGCKIRVAIGDPEGACIKTRGADEHFGHGIASRCELALIHYRPLIGLDGISVHLHDTTLYNSIFRFDDEMLVNTHLYATNAFAAPVLHLRRLAGGELFANYLQSFESVWEGSTPVT